MTHPKTASSIWICPEMVVDTLIYNGNRKWGKRFSKPELSPVSVDNIPPVFGQSHTRDINQSTWFCLSDFTINWDMEMVHDVHFRSEKKWLAVPKNSNIFRFNQIQSNSSLLQPVNFWVVQSCFCSIYHLVMTNSSPWKIPFQNRWTIYK